MTVREGIAARLKSAPQDIQIARLPTRLKLDRTSVRVLLIQRLAINRTVSGGAAAGRLKRMHLARPFRLDVRQRVIVKALVSRHRGGSPGKILGGHLRYLQRSGAGAEGERARLYNGDCEGLAAHPIAREWANDRHHFRFIISPEHGDRIPDMTAFIRETMARVAADLNEPKLQWLAVNHFDTDNPHAHVVVRGRREDGQDLVISRSYVSYGFRARAQEVAQELLGDLSRDEAERRLWREAQADGLTRFDRTLLEQARANNGLAPDPAGRPGTYAALLRARLDHLEGLELAKRTRNGFALHPGLDRELRSLQVSRDIIRTLNERRLAGVEQVREIGEEPVSGTVVRSGYHDELGAQAYVIVRDQSGVEHYASLRVGVAAPEVGQNVTLAIQNRGISRGHEPGLDRG